LQQWYTASYWTLTKLWWKWRILCEKNSLKIAKYVRIVHADFIFIAIIFSEKKIGSITFVPPIVDIIIYRQAVNVFQISSQSNWTLVSRKMTTGCVRYKNIIILNQNNNNTRNLIKYYFCYFYFSLIINKIIHFTN
jgi:hypothetical protein